MSEACVKALLSSVSVQRSHPATPEVLRVTHNGTVAADREALARALDIEDETERLLEVAAIVSEAVAPLGIRPVVVGGLAVAYWTAGAYRTGDIDVVMPYLPEIEEQLAGLGFTRKGRFWILPDRVFLEAPGSTLATGEEAVEAELPTGGIVRILSAEDMLVGRLHEFVATGHSDALGQALMLMEVPELDRVRLERRTADEGLAEGLAALEQVRERVRRGDQLESWELKELARRLR